MNEIKELFAFSRGELIALVTLLLLALTGGGILLFDRIQERIPADVVFQPIEVSPSQGQPQSSPASPSFTDSISIRELSAKKAGTKLRININTAPADSLMLLPHVGKVISARIISHRESQGGFESPAQLIAVRGIGPKYLREILPYITVD